MAQKRRKNKFELYPDEKTGLSKGVLSLIFFAVLWVLLNAAAVMYIRLTKDIYFGNAALSWSMANDIAAGKYGGGFWGKVYASISDCEYNLVAGLPSALFARLFGPSRLSYVLSLVNLYALPSLIVIYRMAKKVGKGEYFSTVAVLLAFPIISYAAFIGHVELGAMLMALICVYLYLSLNGSSVDILRLMGIGVLFVLMMLWRGYFVFFAVAFITAMVADCILFRRSIIDLLLPLFTAAALIALCFRDFAINRIAADYVSKYSSYSFQILPNLKMTARYFGLLPILALAAGSIYAAIKHRERRTLFLWIELLVCHVMFSATQIHGQQQLLMYVPALAALMVLLLRYVNKLWVLGAVCALSVLCSVNVHIPYKPINGIDDIKMAALIPDFSMRPIQRADADTVLEIKKRLDSVVEDGKNVGVMANSGVLNLELMRNAELSLGVKSERADYFAQVPLSRGEDALPLYNVNYMLIAFPAQSGGSAFVDEIVAMFENGTALIAQGD